MSEDLDLDQTIRGFATGQKLFNRFVLKKQLGRGGMGVVWLAIDEHLEREVALKFLPELIRADRFALDDLKRETLRGLHLNHHHIVRIYDFIQHDAWAGISMAFSNGIFTGIVLLTETSTPAFCVASKISSSSLVCFSSCE